MKILLIQPPLNKEAIVFGILEPLALEVLAAAVKQNPLTQKIVEVEILDLRLEKKDVLAKKIKEFNPNIVGITGITIDYPDMIKVLRQVKDLNPDILTAVGGHHATMAPHDFQIDIVDFIVCGPAFKTFPELIGTVREGSYFKKNIPGIFRRHGKFWLTGPDWGCNITNENQPIPDRTLTAKYRRKYYLDDGMPWAAIRTAQGCPFRCTFCACWKAMKGKYIARSAEEIVEEIDGIKEKRVFIGDDNTFADVKRAEKIYELIKERGIKKTYQAYCRADVIVKHPELFRKWAEIGLFALIVGMEATSEEDLAKMNKGCDIATNEKANRILADAGIHNLAHLLIRPDFTEKDFDQVWQYVLKLGIIHPVFPVLTPLPGTDLRAQTPYIHPDEHQYYDLSHPITPTKLDIKDFCRRHKDLLLKNYSPLRWLKARAKKIVNMVLGKNIFPWNETRAPELIIIIGIRVWLAIQVNERKYRSFFEKVRNK